MMSRLQSLGCAVRFLTVIPLPGTGHREVTSSLAWFPLVGLLVGACSAGGGLAAHALFGAPVHAVAAVAASTLVTAGFHLDGLADTCDALFSWRDRARKLEIMTDSRIGAMGATALVLVIALKISALLALGDQWWLGALLCPVFGRWADLYGITRFPAARQEGMGAGVHGADTRGRLLPATALTLVLTAALWHLAGWLWLVMAFLAAFGVMHAFATAVTRSLGGLTGDVYGAMSEIGEVLALLALCAVLA